ncbi:MAG: carbohydrate ABC transporter permease [Thermoleophilaceae bacterium]
MSIAAERPAVRARARRGIRWPRVGLHAFLAITAVLWLAPVVWTFYTSLRPYSDTAAHGYVSVPHKVNLDNYSNAWTQAELPHFFLNSLIITVPAVILTLLFASAVAFVVSRMSFRFNVTLLIVFLAANLLPEQVVLTPLYRLYLRLPLPQFLSDSGLFYDSYIGLIAINVAFQVGFCTFVLSNYMRTIPKTLGDAARVDGASVVRQFFGIILPLSRPALAALATLEFTWIYNNFLWAIVLVQSGDKRPITSALASLQGQFFTNYNLLAAGAMLAALPTLVVFAALQRHFISGLTLGASKG